MFAQGIIFFCGKNRNIKPVNTNPARIQHDRVHPDKIGYGRLIDTKHSQRFFSLFLQTRSVGARDSVRHRGYELDVGDAAVRGVDAVAIFDVLLLVDFSIDADRYGDGVKVEGVDPCV